MKIYILLIISFFVSNYCIAQNNSKNEMEIQFIFYPSSGGDEIYKITLSRGCLEINDLSPYENNRKHFKKVLTKHELDKIK